MAPLTKWQTVVTNRASSPAKLMVIGDSVSEGQGASTRAKRWLELLKTKYRTDYPVGGVAAGFNYIPSWYLVYNPDSPWGQAATSSTGSITWDTWEAGPGYRGATMPTAATITYTVSGTSMDIWYTKNGGTFTYKIDGGAPSGPVDTSGVYAAAVIKGIALGASGSHTVVITCVTGPVYWCGLTVYNQDETKGIQIHDCAHSNATSTLFNDPATVMVMTSIQPHLVIIELGLNDPGSSITPATMKTSIQALVTTALGLASAPSILLVAAYNPAPSVVATATWQNYVTQIKAIADANISTVAYLNLSAVMPTADLSGTGFYRTDGLHPSDSGHTEIYNRIYTVLTTIRDPDKSSNDNEFDRLIAAGYSPGSLRDMQDKELSANPTTSITDRRYAAWAGSGTMIEKAITGGKVWVDVDDSGGE